MCQSDDEDLQRLAGRLNQHFANQTAPAILRTQIHTRLQVSTAAGLLDVTFHARLLPEHHAELATKLATIGTRTDAKRVIRQLAAQWGCEATLDAG